MPDKYDTPKRNTFILPKYRVEPEYPPRHKIGQLGRLKQDCPIAWIFPSNRINSQGSIAALQDSYKASLQDSHKNGCETYTTTRGGGGRSPFAGRKRAPDTPARHYSRRALELYRACYILSVRDLYRNISKPKKQAIGRATWIFSVTNRAGRFGPLS